MLQSKVILVISPPTCNLDHSILNCMQVARHCSLWWCTITLHFGCKKISSSDATVKSYFGYKSPPTPNPTPVTLTLMIVHQSFWHNTGSWWCTDLLSLVTKVEQVRKYHPDKILPISLLLTAAMNTTKSTMICYSWGTKNNQNQFQILSQLAFKTRKMELMTFNIQCYHWNSMAVTLPMHVHKNHNRTKF